MKLGFDTEGLLLTPEGWTTVVVPQGAELFTREASFAGEPYVEVFARANGREYAVSDVDPDLLDGELEYLTTSQG